jgi:hypothetical protein
VARADLATTTKRELWGPVGSGGASGTGGGITADGTNGPSYGIVGTSGQAQYGAWKFDSNPNGTGDDWTHGWWTVPTGYVVDSLTVKLYWTHPSAETNLDDFVWDGTVAVVAAGATYDSAGTGIDAALARLEPMAGRRPRSPRTEAILAARRPHHFLSVTKGGHTAIVSTKGNDDCHIILRGGKEPNYDAASVCAACDELARHGLDGRLMIDASHGNSLKQHERQFEVADAAARQLEAGERRIVGVMVESNLVGGRQDLAPGRQLAHGQSITDACLGWEESVRLLDRLAAGVRGRRACSASDSHARPTRP